MQNDRADVRSAFWKCYRVSDTIPSRQALDEVPWEKLMLHPYTDQYSGPRVKRVL